MIGAMDTASWYRAFAQVEASGSSPIYETLARAVADSPEIVGRLEELPVAKRQPNLLLASARLVGAPLDDPFGFADFVTARWSDVAGVMVERSTQTNEPARTAAFLPLLAAIEGPVALIEVGCSAGLCMFPDQYSISYNGAASLVPHSPVRVDVEASGPVPVPNRLPEVVGRIGVDLNPLDVTDAEDLAWLEVLIWPEHVARLARLRAAVQVVADDPPTLLRGDLVDTIDDAIAMAPPESTKVVFHSAVLNYLDPTARVEFAERVRRHPRTVWFANEAPGVLEGVTTELLPPSSASARAFFVLSEGTRRTFGISDPHGTWLRWAGVDPA